MKTRFSFVIVGVLVLAVLVGALFFAGSGIVSADPLDGGLPDTEIYVHDGAFVITTTEKSILVDGVILTDTTVVEGRFFWQGSRIDGEVHQVTDGVNPYVIVTGYNLFPGESYSDTSGMAVVASPEEWGEMGVVLYSSPDSEDSQIYTLAGYGYDLQVSTGTLFWHYDTLEWSEEPQYGFFTAISVLKRPKQPTLTLGGQEEIHAMESGFYTATLAGESLPLSTEFRWEATDHTVFTDTAGIQDVVSLSWGTPGTITVQVSAEGITTTLVVTVTPKMYTVFLPLAISNRPPTCLENTPFEVTGWQTDAGYGVCSWARPADIDGVAPERVVTAHYNWIYTGITGPQARWLAPGSFDDDLFHMETSGQAGLAVVCDNCAGFRRVYALWGFGYQLVYWPNEVRWYANNAWSSTPAWNEYTLLGVK